MEAVLLLDGLKDSENSEAWSQLAFWQEAAGFDKSMRRLRHIVGCWATDVPAVDHEVYVRGIEIFLQILADVTQHRHTAIVVISLSRRAQ